MAELKRTVSLIIRENAGIDSKGNELYLNHTFPHFNPDLTDEELQTLGREYADLFYGCRGPVGRLLSYDVAALVLCPRTAHSLCRNLLTTFAA